jgi:hypothetical protein
MMAAEHQSGDLQSYRKQAERVGALRHDLEARVAKAAESGDLETARKALDELTLATKNLEVQREKLSQVDLFLAKYGVLVHDKHTVSFVIPRGTSRYEMLVEASNLVMNESSPRYCSHRVHFIYPDMFDQWSRDPKFVAPVTILERRCIRGHVALADARTREEHLKFLEQGGLDLATVEDLASAFVAGFVATGEPIFGWPNTFFMRALGAPDSHSTIVRARGGALHFSAEGGLLFYPDLILGQDSCVLSAVVPIESLQRGSWIAGLERVKGFLRKMLER